jgi:hypothetical protein
LAIPGNRPEPGGESPQGVPEGQDAGEYRRPAAKRGIAARVIMPLALLTGLWVVVSPRFLSLPHGGTDAVADVIIGLVVAGVVTLALVGRRGLPGLRFTGLVLGVWAVLISAFLPDARVSPAAPLSWSNTWSGALLALLALAELASLRPVRTGHVGEP